MRTKQSNLGYADVFLNIPCMHCLAGLGMLSLCVYYDLYGLGAMAWVYIDGCVLCVGEHSSVRECVLFQTGLFVSQQNFHFLGAENKLL